MSAIHQKNRGIIGAYDPPTPGSGNTSGVWQIGNTDEVTTSYTFVNPTPVSTNIGYSHQEPDSSNQYIFSSRNLTVFYEDAYGSSAHVALTSGSAGSYTDVRKIGNDNGAANGNSFIVSYSNKKCGYKWVNQANIKGFTANGLYGSRTFSNNGTLDILTWDGSTWSTLESDVDITNGGSINWSGAKQTYLFAGGPVKCKGLAIQANAVSTYWAISFFAPIDVNDANFLGHT